MDMSIDQAEKDEKEEQKAEMNFRFTLIEELRGIRRALEPKEQLVCKQIMNDGLTCNTRYEKVLDLLEVSKAERNMFAKELKIATDALQEATNSELRWTKKYEEEVRLHVELIRRYEQLKTLNSLLENQLKLERNQREPG